MSYESEKSAFVYHRNKNGLLLPYNSRTSEAILVAATKRSEIACLVDGWNNLMTFDLKSMKQLKGILFEEEDIVIEIPWNSKVLKVAASLKGDDFLQRKILVMALGRIRERQFLTEVLDLKSVPYQLVCVNSHLGPGHAPYDNFVENLMTATETWKSSPLYEAILEIVSDGPTGANLSALENRGLGLVVHGTNEAVMDNILETGLLPSYRISREDWFGVSYYVGLAYTKSKSPCIYRIGKSGMKVLVFMVLRTESGCTDHAHYITSNSNKFQLPLAEITLKDGVL